jgi:hypothetical protein
MAGGWIVWKVGSGSGGLTGSGGSGGTVTAGSFADAAAYGACGGKVEAEKTADPFGDAVKAAQDQPEPNTNYTPERFSDNEDFDADKAWRETMGSNW